MSELTDLYDKKVKCPVCEFEFSTKKVRSSKLRLLKRDEDFLNHYKSENPIKYNIFVCPKCGFSAWESRYEQFKPENKGLILKNITAKWVPRDFGGERSLDDAIEAYKLALLNGMFLKCTNLEQANTCLNIAWLYRLKEEVDEEIRFMTMARDRFMDAYNGESLSGTNMDESKLSYLIGELSRRINDKNQAQVWLGVCINLPATKLNPSIDDMAREQWRLVKEM